LTQSYISITSKAINDFQLTISDFRLSNYSTQKTKKGYICEYEGKLNASHH
jgi:hypothetical protein